MSIEPPRPLRLQPEDESAVRAHIGRAVERARLALLWEAVWPKLVPFLVVAGVFLVLSWFGIWIGMPEWLRVATLAVFGLAALGSLVPLIRVRLPGQAEALARVEHNTGTPHRPATAVLDTLGAQHDDPATRAIWEAHRARLLAGIGTLKAGLPSPGMARKDPYALRFLVLFLLVVAFIASSSGIRDRVADAFRGAVAPATAAVAARIDAWAAPPDYTGRAPIFLTGETLRSTTGPISVPQGTEIIVRVGGGESAVTVFATPEQTGTAPVAGLPAGEGATEHRMMLATNTGVTVRDGDRDLFSWHFAIVTDVPPTIAFASDPTRTNAGSLRFTYTVQDDYGVASARAEIGVAEPVPGAVPLVGPPDLALTVPANDAEGGLLRDLTQHPWAGLLVTMALVAVDAVGQQGRSELRTFVLPERAFTNPLARALIEQRRNLALDVHSKPRVASALDLLAIAPEFLPGTGTYLALRSVYHRLLQADGEQALLGVVDYLWEIAVAIEDDQLADAAAQLQAATDALRDAIDRNASPEEIQALMDVLRQAMADFVDTLAQNADPPAGNPPTQQISPEDLGQMLDDLQERAETGDRNAANNLLNQLQQMMQNLQMGNVADLQNQGPPPGDDELRELGDIILDQQRIRDETFALQQQQNAPMPTPRTDEEARQLLDELRARRAEEQATLDALQEEQGALQGQLDRLMAEMEALGMFEPNDTLGAARENMGQAGEALGMGDVPGAVGAQGEALDNLQGGAMQMADQLAAQQGGQVTRPEGGGAGEDPFGRPVPTQGPDFGNGVELPEEIDRQRAREILDTIRQRLEELGRPELERDYLERLLDAF